MPAEILSLPENYKAQNLILSLEEAKALYRIFEHEFVSYEWETSHEVMRKIMKFIREHEDAAT